MAARNNSSHHSPSSKVNTNFGGLDKKYSGKDAKIVVIPVPYDKTSTWVKGADRGPEAILEASANMELYDIETDSEGYLQGIITDKAVLEDETPEKMVKSVEEGVNKDIYNNDGWMDKAIAKLKENVYLTIDLDALDPSIMPSTGTPEPGGMLWYQTITFLRKVIQKRNVVGLDVVELCPNEEHKAPDFLTAKLIYTILSYKFSK